MSVSSQRSDGPDVPPPPHLSDAAQQIWREILDGNEMDAAALPILLTLCEARDRWAVSGAAMREKGATIIDRFGVEKVSPHFAINRDSAAIMHRAFRLLGFDQEARGSNAQELLFK